MKYPKIKKCCKLNVHGAPICINCDTIQALKNDEILIEQKSFLNKCSQCKFGINFAECRICEPQRVKFTPKKRRSTPEFNQNNCCKKRQKVDHNELHVAAATSDITRAKELIKRRYTNIVLEQTNAGLSAFWFAVRNPCLHMIELLAKSGCDVNAKVPFLYFGFRRMAPIQFAVATHQTELVHVLLHYGANINEKDDNNATILHVATFHGFTDVVQLLLSHGAKVNAVNNRGETALFIAATTKNRYIFRMLVDYNAKVNDCNNNKRSVVDVMMKSCKVSDLEDSTNSKTSTSLDVYT